MKRLVLFDIDGTLLHGGPLWRECFEKAFQERFPSYPIVEIPFGGKTDPQICRELLSESCCPTPQMIDEVLTRYLDRVQRALLAGRASEVRVFPGVPDLLEALSRHPAIRLGLLTGNVKKGAELKLSAVGLLERFPHGTFGAFGDDHWDRRQLPQIAIDRAEAAFGHRYQGKEIVIVGDTEHDVTCGQTLGVRAIAVATGRPEHRVRILEAKPDFFLETLEDTDAVMETILRQL